MSYFMELNLHGYTAAEAKKKLDDALKTLPKDVGELTVIHGYRGGTALRDMVRRYKHPKVERKMLGLNQGSTVFVVTYSPTYRGGGFSLKYGNPYSINELSPCVPRL